MSLSRELEFVFERAKMANQKRVITKQKPNMLATITSSIEEHKGNYKKAHIDDLMLETDTIIDARVV